MLCEAYERQLIPILAKNDISSTRVSDSELVTDFESAIAKALSLPVEQVKSAYKEFQKLHNIDDSPLCKNISHWFIEYLDPSVGVIQFMVDTDCIKSNNYSLTDEVDLSFLTNVNLERHDKVICFVCSHYKNTTLPELNGGWRPDVLEINGMKVIPGSVIEETFTDIGVNNDVWKCPELKVRKVFITKNNEIYPEYTDAPYIEGAWIREFRKKAKN